MRAGRWRFWDLVNRNNLEALTVASSESNVKIMLLDFTASEQNAVQHLGQEQPPVCGDEHLPDHFHCQPELADTRLETGLWALRPPVLPLPKTPHRMGVSQGFPLPALLGLCGTHLCKTFMNLQTLATSKGHQQDDKRNWLYFVLQ